MTLIAVGDMADKLVSWSAFTTSIDNELWTVPTRPFVDRCKANGVAVGLGKYVAISDSGYVSNSTDGVNWFDYHLIDGNLSPYSIVFANGKFVMCGQRKFLVNEGPYTELDEAAQILVNNSGENWDWQLIYSCYSSNNSRFYNVKYIADAPTPTWVALGSADGKPFGIYSVDNCVTWNEIKFPNFELIFAAYDIVWNINKFYITVNGMILNTAELEIPVWGASQILSVPYGNTDLVKLEKNPAGHMVTVCSGGIFYSIDQVGWVLFKQDGYRFKSIAWHNNEWIAGADSNLTTYTYWRSADTFNWIPYYQPVQIYDFTQI